MKRFIYTVSPWNVEFGMFYFKEGIMEEGGVDNLSSTEQNTNVKDINTKCFFCSR